MPTLEKTCNIWLTKMIFSTPKKENSFKKTIWILWRLKFARKNMMFGSLSKHHWGLQELELTEAFLDFRLCAIFFLHPNFVNSKEAWKIPFEGRILGKNFWGLFGNLLEKKTFSCFFFEISRIPLKIFSGFLGKNCKNLEYSELYPHKIFLIRLFIFRGFTRKNLFVWELFSKRFELKTWQIFQKIEFLLVF